MCGVNMCVHPLHRTVARYPAYLTKLPLLKLALHPPCAPSCPLSLYCRWDNLVQLANIAVLQINQILPR